MSESGMRSTVVKALSSLHAISVENPALPGTPDVNYIEGWIELKWLRNWPKQIETVVRFDHFTPQPRIWHLKRRHAGGRCWVLIQCKREWLLFDGAVAALNINRCAYCELVSLAAHYWPRGLSQKELVACIQTEQPPFKLTVEQLAKIRPSERGHEQC